MYGTWALNLHIPRSASSAGHDTRSILRRASARIAARHARAPLIASATAARSASRNRDPAARRSTPSRRSRDRSPRPSSSPHPHSAPRSAPRHSAPRHSASRHSAPQIAAALAALVGRPADMNSSSPYFLPLQRPAFLVNCAMVSAAQQHEIVESGSPAIGPVLDVVRIAEAVRASGEPAAAVPLVERAPDRGRHGARAAPDIQHIAVRAVRHHDAARVARQSPRRFRGNANAIEHGKIAGLSVGVASALQCSHIDVQHDLEAVSPGHGAATRLVAREPVAQRGFGDETQRIGPPLGWRGCVRVRRLLRRAPHPAPAAAARQTSGSSRPRTTYAPSSSMKTVKCRRRVPFLFTLPFLTGTVPPPRAHDLLQIRRRAGSSEIEELVLGRPASPRA
jgi:hypothetical protein